MTPSVAPPTKQEQFQAIASALRAWLTRWSPTGRLSADTSREAADELARRLTEAGLQVLTGDVDALKANAAAFPDVPGNWLIDVLTPLHDLRTVGHLEAERMIETIRRWAQAYARGDHS